MNPKVADIVSPFSPSTCLGVPVKDRVDRERERRGLRRLTIGVSEDDLRVNAEHGYEGAASADQDQQAQAVSLFITHMLAASIRPG
jgi:hypothetical protein